MTPTDLITITGLNKDGIQMNDGEGLREDILATRDFIWRLIRMLPGDAVIPVEELVRGMWAIEYLTEHVKYADEIK